MLIKAQKPTAPTATPAEQSQPAYTDISSHQALQSKEESETIAAADTGTTVPTTTETASDIRSFNKKLALDLQRKLKSKKPDITASFVLGTLHTWKNSKRYPYVGNRVPGAVYQSVEGICEDLPWLDRSTVLRAIERLEEAFPKDFTVSRESTKVLNFEISSKLTKQYFSQNKASKNEGSVNLSLHVSDALKYGAIAGVLIRNLEFKTLADKVTKPVRDDQGRIYGQMSSSKLTKETKSPDGSASAPILPFGRQAVNKAILSLLQRGVFVEHMERRGFYRVEKGPAGELEPPKVRENRLSSNAIVVSSNAIVVSSNATVVSSNATVYSGQIERDRNPDRREIESDKDSPESSPAARPVEPSNFDTEGLERAKAFYPVPDISRDPLILVESSTVPCNEETSVPANSTAPVNFPRFLKDEFPGWMPELKAEVQRLKNALKTPIEPVHPDLLPFDVIIDWERHCWIESELQINPLTDMPIDLANFEEQIDIAVDELEIESSFSTRHSKKDMLEFREHFKRHEGLSIPMIRKMLERIADACQLPAFRSSKKEKVDHYYFARIIKDLKTFNRYFKQLFRETFAPFVNEQGEARFEEEGRMRWWPKGEEIWAEDFEYPLCESPENMPEPFRSILAKDIEQEREKLFCVEALQRTLQDAQDNGRIEVPPTDQDLLSGPEMDAFWREKETEPEECRGIRSIKLLPTHEESVNLGYPSMKPKAEEAFEEHTAMWYLMKRLGLDATGKIPVASLSRFPAMESKQGDSQSSDPDVFRSIP